MNDAFDVVTLGDDLCAVRGIYTTFFSRLDEAKWDEPVKGGSKEWTLHQTVAHLCALTGAGLESIQAALRGEAYAFSGLENRYQFNAFNHHGIEEQLPLPMKDLCAKFLTILDEAIEIARCMKPAQTEITSEMSIYNRPVKMTEALGIILFHASLAHAAQVAEPTGVPPLWTHLSPVVRHRLIGRVMRALSLLYRFDLGGPLKAILVFRVDGLGGGNWHIDISPETCTSEEGEVEHARLTIHLRDTAAFCQMFTGRLKLPVAFFTGQLKLRGDLRLFPRMGRLFSVDARP